ncbi:MAG: hypothetical protein FWF10_04965 [Clostridiales bacterium]|nr:hypothetical protein [Clostridiales bacterium]
MDYQYYVQIIAANYLKNVMDDPVSRKIHDRFLGGLRADAFAAGLSALRALVRRLYGDIARNPADFQMALKDIVEYDAKTTDYLHSHNSFIRVPHLLLVLGAGAALQPDMSLAIDGGVLASDAKQLKITGLPFLLAKLRDYGFAFGAFGKSPKPGETLTISYLDNPCLCAALRAMATALLELSKGDLKSSKNNWFYMLHPGLLENETIREPKLGVDSIYHALDTIQREYAAALHDVAARGTKQTIRMGGFMRNDWSCVYVGKQNKKVLMSLQVCQDSLSVKLNLQHINRYMPLVMALPESVREQIRASGWACARCNTRCSGGFAFEMDGVAYDKCRCGSFVFDDLTEEAVISCQRLLAQELLYS